MLALRKLAMAQSRRVGDHATLRVTVLSDSDFPWFVDELTVERLHHHFAALELEQIRRFELTNLGSLHFVLCDAYASLPRHWLLDGNGSLLATHSLDLELPVIDPSEIKT
jgi:hypothetical protein